MLCPKGVSFLYASKDFQKYLEPLVVSWGWESDNPSDSKFLDYNQYQGTNDISAYLTVPKAIEFLGENNWEAIKKDCRNKILETRELLLKTTGTNPICDEKLLGQMTSVKLNISDSDSLYRYLKINNIEIPIIKWNGIILLRVSFQCYNTMEQIEYLNHHIKKYLNGNL